MSHISNTYDSRVKMSQERKRLAQVRKAFQSGVKQKSEGGNVENAFFNACVVYIKASMDRLHAQDQRIHDFLVPHVTGDGHEGILENLDMRLASSREALVSLVGACDAFMASEGVGWNAFRTAVGKFMEVYFKILLSAQHSTLTLQEEVFDEKTWDRVTGFTPESLAREQDLFATVQSAAPNGADPASFVGGPPASGAGTQGKGARPDS